MFVTFGERVMLDFGEVCREYLYLVKRLVAFRDSGESYNTGTNRHSVRMMRKIES